NRAIWGRHVSCMARGTGICSVPDNVLTNGAMFGLLSRHVIHNQLETLFCPFYMTRVRTWALRGGLYVAVSSNLDNGAVYN
ncbi:unnamed protein product, partial [Fusarium graminearum]